MRKQIPQKISQEIVEKLLRMFKCVFIKNNFATSQAIIEEISEQMLIKIVENS